MKKYSVFPILLLFVLLFSACKSTAPLKVACIGNSITYGYGLKNPRHDSYPAVLSRMLGKKYEVRNFGISARTMLMKGDLPYMKEPIYHQALAFQPDIVTIKLGTNDSKPENWKYKDDFKTDMETMVDTLQALPSHPDIYICFPVPATAPHWGINDSVIYHEIIPIIRQVAKEKKVHFIDLYSPLKPYPECFPDHIHPDIKGSKLIAKNIYIVLKHARKKVK